MFEEEFLAQLGLIDRIVRHTCRRYRCRAEEAEEFRSIVQLKLIADDYAVFRKFKRQSSMSTYLTTVIQRLFLDYRNHLWGKWRPSAEARRRGPTAEHLERLVARDGLSLDEACQALRTNHGAPESEAEIKGLADRLRLQPRWHQVSEEEIGELAARDGLPDHGIAEEERGALKQRVLAVLERAIEQLPAEDRLIVRLRMEDGVDIAEIARLLNVDAKRLYPRVEGILRGLRRRLEGEGIGADLVGEVLAEDEGSSSSLAGPA